MLVSDFSRRVPTRRLKSIGVGRFRVVQCLKGVSNGHQGEAQEDTAQQDIGQADVGGRKRPAHAAPLAARHSISTAKTATTTTKTCCRRCPGMMRERYGPTNAPAITPTT